MKRNKRMVMDNQDAEKESIKDIIKELLDKKYSIEQWKCTNESIVTVMECLELDVDSKRKDLFIKQIKLLKELSSNFDDIIQTFKDDLTNKKN